MGFRQIPAVHALRNIAVAVLLLVSVFSLSSATCAQGPISPDGSQQFRIKTAPAPAVNAMSLPVSFVPNRGQWPDDVEFQSQGLDYVVALSKSAATLTLSSEDGASETAVSRSASTPQLRISVLHGLDSTNGLAEQPTRGVANFYSERRAKNAVTGVPTYSRVRYPEVYPGIGLIYYATNHQLEFDFVIQAGSDPREIEFRVGGVDHLRVLPDGKLTGLLGKAPVTLPAPSAYQVDELGNKSSVRTSYLVKARNRVSFRVEKYDKSRTLTIDPVLVYSTVFADPSGLHGPAFGVAVDATGIYVGLSNTVLPSVFTFIVKLDPTGQTALYTTSFQLSVLGTGMTVDSSGQLYIESSASTNTPGWVPLLPSDPRFGRIGFVKLDATGKVLLSSGIAGNTEAFSSPNAIAADNSGNVYLTGTACDAPSGPFPYVNAPQLPANSVDPNSGESMGCGAYLVKIDTVSPSVVYSRLFAGNPGNLGIAGNGIAVDGDGNAVIAGDMPVAGFPATRIWGDSGANSLPFVAKFDPSGSMIFADLIGGSSNSDIARAIALDPAGNIYVAGEAGSSDFPVIKPIQGIKTSTPGTRDAFVSKFSPDGSQLLFSTYFGGDELVRPLSLVVDSNGIAFLGGESLSVRLLGNPPYPHSPNPGNPDWIGFAAKVDTVNSYLRFSTFVGSTVLDPSTNDHVYSVATDGLGSLYAAGLTSDGANFPQVNPFRCCANSGGGFATKFIDTLRSDRPQIAFADQPTNTSSVPQVLTTSSPSQSVIMGAALISGQDAASFSVTNTCYLQQISAGGSCATSVMFSPLHSGPHSAELQIADIYGNDRHIIPLSGNGTGTAPTYATPSYQVSVLDGNIPPNSQVSITGFNNHDSFAATLSIATSPFCENVYSGDLPTAFYYAGGQYINLSAVAGSLAGTIDPTTGCQFDSRTAGMDDAGNVYGEGTESQGQVNFVYDGSSMRTIQQNVSDGSSVTGNVTRVLSSGLVLFDDFSYFENGSVKQTNPIVPPNVSAQLLFDTPTRSWVTSAPFTGNPGFTDENSQGIAAGSAQAFDVPLEQFGFYKASIFSAGVITEPDGPDANFFHFVSANSSGQTVGIFGSPNFVCQAYYWDRTTGLHNLDSLLPAGWTTDQCQIISGTPLINDAGHILTGAIDSTGTPHLVILSPVVATPIGSNIFIQSGATSINFTSVAASGTTTVQPIDPSMAGTVDGGFAISDTIAYQISSTATFGGPVTIGFVVPGPISQSDFSNLRVFHNLNGTLVDITSSYDYVHLTIFGTTTSFSPFYLGRAGTHVTMLTDTSKAFKSGSTVPIKVQVITAGGANLSSSALQVKARGVLRLQDSTELDVTDAGNSNPDFDFRYDPTIGTSGGYIYNLSTSGLKSGKYSLSMYVGPDRKFVYSVTFDIR